MVRGVCQFSRTVSQELGERLNSEYLPIIVMVRLWWGGSLFSAPDIGLQCKMITNAKEYPKRVDAKPG